jgi:signal transduction histidine kinase
MVMLIFIVLVQLGTLMYIWKVESRLLLQKEEKNLRYQLENKVKSLSNHMHALQKELEFLASLNIMDDVITEDIDKRISILLEKKAHDLSEDIVLIAKNKKEEVSRSTLYRDSKVLIFHTPIKASFNHQIIGELVLLYPLKNFKNISSPQLHQVFSFFSNKVEIYSLEKYESKIIVSSPLPGILHGYRLFLSSEKAFALQTVREIEKILLLAFLISLFSLLFISWKLFKKQIMIVEHTQEILEVKRTFLSMMSHELRTPLGSILTLTQHLMISENMKGKEIDILSHIESASEHLLAMINNLLQLSKLESNTMIIKKESIDIIECMNEIIEMVYPLIEDKDLFFQKKISVEKKEIIIDKAFFVQIMMNLLSNAIKFTPRGSISLSLIEMKNGYLLSINDTGIGIEKSKQVSLFSEYYKAHSEDKNIKHSSGLGLALSQKLAQIIEGNIKIYSEGLGKGTQVSFYFKSF